MQKFEIVKSRDRFRDAKNITSTQTDFMKMKEMKITFKKQKFQNFTIKEFSRFEHVEMKIAVARNETVNSAVERAMQHAFTRSRDRDRPKGRDRDDRANRANRADRKNRTGRTGKIERKEIKNKTANESNEKNEKNEKTITIDQTNETDEVENVE